MKRRDLLSALLDAILAAVIAIAGVGCLTSGLSLDTNMSAVVLTALAFGLLAAVLCRLPVSWIWILLTLALGAQTLWVLEFGDFFYPQLKAVLTIYHKVYGWGVPKWLEAYEPCSATMTACVITAGVAIVAGISLKINQYPGALLALLLPVIPCIVVTDTPPDGLYLWLGFVCIGVLTLTWNSRRIDTRQANRLTAMVLIPVMLANILLFSRNPQSEYDAPDRGDGIFQKISSLIDRLPFMNMIPEGSNPIQMVSSPQDVDLSVLGPNDHAEETVMTVHTSFDGPIYLRGRSYDIYTGTSWYASDGEETLMIPALDYLKSSKQTIQTHSYAIHEQQYIPYYLIKPITMEQGFFPNDGGVDSVFTIRPLRADWKILWDEKYGYITISDLEMDDSLSQYLNLNWLTIQYAQLHLNLAGVNVRYQSVLDVVETIRNYVRESAEYDLNTESMPSGERDFAMWFLEDSETGYCVHFATAATVLLRAAGIPARYVEGYLVEAQNGKSVRVTSALAHAWVEYYLPDVGWVVLETTPGDGLPVTLPEEPTIPPDTFPTLPTAPSAPTMPTLPTAPTEPTEPTEPTTEPTEPTPPETTVPTEPTQPSTSTGPSTTPTEPIIPPDTPAEPRDWSGLLKALRWIALGLAMLAVVIGQRWLRMWLRRKKMRGSAWPQVRARWLYACRLAKMCGYESPAALEALAKKARFSQHTLSDKELRQFDRYTDACIRILQRKPWPIRMVYRLVLAIW